MNDGWYSGAAACMQEFCCWKVQYNKESLLRMQPKLGPQNIMKFASAEWKLAVEKHRGALTHSVTHSLTHIEALTHTQPCTLKRTKKVYGNPNKDLVPFFPKSSASTCVKSWGCVRFITGGKGGWIHQRSLQEEAITQSTESNQARRKRSHYS